MHAGEPAESERDAAVELAAAVGFEADEWQASVLESWLGRGADGRWAHNRCGLSVPRQNGKNGVVLMRELYGMVMLGERIVHTAHQVKTAREHWMNVSPLFDPKSDRRVPWLASRVRVFREANGQEMIELKGGGRIQMIARSGSSGLGFTNDLLVLDEAQELTFEQIRALNPTVTAGPAGNSQQIMLGTPPTPGVAAEVFKKWRSEALSGGAGRLCWHEWSVEEAGDVADRSRWYATNPALGIRIAEDAVEAELATMDAASFASDRLGLWQEHAGVEHVLTEAEWNGCLTKDPPREGTFAYGVKFAPDGSTVSLAVCVRPDGADGRPPHVECVAMHPQKDGIGWLVRWLWARRHKACAVALDGRVGAGDLAARLMREGLPPDMVWLSGARDVVDAAAMTVAAVREGRLTHFGQPLLTESACFTKRRRIGTDGGFGWASTDTAEASPMEAAALAYRAAMTSRIRPGRRQRIL